MSQKRRKISVLFICLGNICRSPAAEAILKNQSKDYLSLDVYVESCGLGDWHVGHGADARMKEACRFRDIELTGAAQVFKLEFFDRFDYLLAADEEVHQHLFRCAKTQDEKSKIHLMTEYSSIYKRKNVPDPYYGGLNGFDVVLDMLEDSCKGLLEYIQSKS